MYDEKGSINPKRIVEKGYDQVAYDYTHLEGKKKWPRMQWLKKLLKHMEPGSSILDLGCGSGDPADIEIAKKHHVTGVDISQAQINLAHQNVPCGCFIHGDAETINFPPASFDAVVSFYTLEHIPRDKHQKVLGHIYKWLKGGGYLLLSMEAGEYDNEIGNWLGVPMFISCFTPEIMKQLIISKGFHLVETAIETQLEGKADIPYHWIFARKPE
jgi:ubiquinone/menaquinone biosynthesis C-methylase UbiE